MKTFFLILAIVIFVFIILLLFSKITLSFNAEKSKGQKLKTYYKIKFFGGLFSIKKSVKPHEKKPKEKVKEQTKEDDVGFLKRIKDNYKTFCAFKYAYKNNSLKLKKSIYAKKINLHIDFGFGDAMTTGILTGALWTGIYNVISFIASVITIAEPNINIVPNYNQNKYSVKLECIITSRLANLIAVAASLGLSYLKFTKKRQLYFISKPFCCISILILSFCASKLYPSTCIAVDTLV